MAHDIALHALICNVKLAAILLGSCSCEYVRQSLAVVMGCGQRQPGVNCSTCNTTQPYKLVFGHVNVKTTPTKFKNNYNAHKAA